MDSIVPKSRHVSLRSYTLPDNTLKTSQNAKMTSAWQKFTLLIWKNWLLQWRHPIQTAVEILSPVLFSALLVVIRSLVDPETYPDDTIYVPFDPAHNPFKSHSWIQAFLKRFRIAWSPRHPLLERIVNATAKAIHVRTYPCNNAYELENYLTSPNVMDKTIAGIEFDDEIAENNSTLPNVLTIKLRFPAESRFESLPRQEIGASNWRTNFLFPLYQIAGPRIKEANDGGYPPGYNGEGFLLLQQYISKSVIDFWQNITGQKPIDPLPNIKLQRYPYINYIDDPLLPALEGFVSVIIMLSFVYTCISTVKVITTEKEKQLKETMKIMGLPNWLHWTAWFIKTLSFVFISIIFITVLLKVRWYSNSENCVFTYTASELIFLILLLYMFTTITFCFLISVFFTKANTASTIAGLMWFLSYSPYLFLQERYEELSLLSKLLACLGHNTAMAYGFQLILMFEGTGEGVQWGNIWKSPIPDNDFVLGHVILMLIADMILYLIIALYIEQVMPGEFGVPQPWYFIFTVSYWCGIPPYIGIEDNSSIADEYINSNLYEDDPVNLHAGIQIKHLKKIYKGTNKKIAVNDLSLNMYEDQITVLLGHNGAGKTTTMSMLTGIFPPTSGTAIINGHDIRTDMHGVRASLGLCPQHNVLFDELTVQEHLYFFSCLKGLNKSSINEEIAKYVQLLDLEQKKKSQSYTLSGGMQRKLSVGIALIGGSRVVMLDEPTSGMDPAARRAMWDLLQKEKKGRTLLLTTHFMDEADLLGDRIAIMAGGSLQCCGSSFFLKKHYGAGYHLVLDKKENCEPDKITNMLQKYIPNIYVDTDIGSELSYLLTEDQASKFETMLKELEDNSEKLQINSYGISLTTLEEVFMKVGADKDSDEDNKAIVLNETNNVLQNIESNNIEIQMTNSENTRAEEKLLGLNLNINQLQAMFMKKILATARSWMLFLIQLIIPIVFIIITVLVTRSWKTGSDLPAMEMNLDAYGETVTVINVLDNNNNSEIWRNNYKLAVKSSKGKIKDIGNQNISDFILEQSRIDLPKVRQHYIVGGTFEKDEVIGWFNNEPYHGAPLSLNLIHNSLLKTLNESYEIRLINKPLPFVLETKLKKLEQGNNMGFQIAFNIGFSMAFVSSFYVLFYVRERATKSKHLQFVSGVKVLTFWGSAYIWDMLTFIFTSICLIISLGIFQEDGFKTAGDLGRIFSVLVCFGYAMLPMMYLSSFCFDIPSTGYTRMTLINIFTGVAGFLVVEILAAPGLNLEHVSKILDWIFLLVPHYALSTSLRSMYKVYATNKICEIVCENKVIKKCLDAICTQTGKCCTMETNYYSWAKPGMGRQFLYLICVGAILIVTLLVIEYRLIERLLYKNQNILSVPPEEELDDDVSTEKLKIHNLLPNEIKTYNLVLRDVTKYYKNNFLAVNRLCVGVKQYECFGLLGVNGAGKTSTFKMMTGDEKISYGDAWVNGLSLKSNMKQVHQMIGYCPQFDALIDDLTGRETLKMFCLLRGIKNNRIDYIANKLAVELNFTKHLDKKTKEYSGGNKRKLSTAIALIGDPSVIYLDEPTTGMDPATKRHLWNVVCKIRDAGHCVILTSHSMEECEALCTRIAIMVNGNFRCLGSIQHLKNKFSAGFTLTIKIKKTKSDSRKYEFNKEETEPIKQFVFLRFEGATLREEHQGLLTFYIVNKKIPWSQMFGIMENGKNILNIEDYSLGQSSLEQVFLTFAKKQRTE